ncbi:uncharacterized protein LOC132742275 [Ruditapes philippinarum]|uniref:uncharacterized protein LOC132742275 n=1 Tax=Ruditapes philippinarum TaxID=129788 RepID=UPI00295ABBE7|nr:uncharacterized protein LOC132742275 [Ruditapes philippinarum]
MREIDRNEAEMFITGSVHQIATDETLKGKRRKRTRFRYTFHGKPICKKAFMYVNDIGSKALRNLLDHFTTNGAIPRTHGNSGRKPHHALGYNEIRFCVDWILWYADINRLPMPAAPRGRDGEAPILLPSNLTKASLHSQYCQACEESDVRKLGVSSFKNVWKNCIPHIKIMSPKDDVCHKCEQLRHSVMDAVTEQAKLDAANCHREHVQDAQTERQAYMTAVIQAREEMVGYTRPTIPVAPISTEFSKVHITFDYSQSVTIPHHSRQMGPMHVLCNRQENKYVRYPLIDEDQSIGLDGTGTHGLNSVLSMLHHCLHNYGFGEKGLYLHADNCGGQNKNRYTLAYLCWRVNRGLHEHMAIPGHTKCLVDGGFGRIKKLFKRSDCESLSQFADIVDKSTRNNFRFISK